MSTDNDSRESLDERLQDLAVITGERLEAGESADVLVEELVDAGFDREGAAKFVGSVAAGLPPDWDEVYQSVVKEIAERLAAGESQTQVVEVLVEGGIERAIATVTVTDVAKALRSQGFRSGVWGLVWGGVLLALGIGITAGTYSAAGPGGVYFITWGLVLAGGWRIITALIQVLQNMPGRGAS